MRALLALAVFTALAMASTLVYAFGDALAATSLGNLDVVMVPLFGMAGYDAFEVVMPFVSLSSIVLAVRESYILGQRGLTLETTEGVERLTLGQWLRLRIFGKVSLGRRYRGLELFAFRCSCGRTHVDYPRGWKEDLKCTLQGPSLSHTESININPRQGENV